MKVRNPGYCWLWTGQKDRDGYGLLSHKRAHRIAWELANAAELAPGQIVRHSCDNPTCCNPHHLLTGSQADNVRDRDERKRAAKGVFNGRNKLTEKQVLMVAASDEASSVLAAQLGVAVKTINDIRAGRNWRWLTGIRPERREVLA